MQPHKPPFLLKEIKIELTYRCSLSCLHCSSDSTPEAKTTITPARAISIIEQAITMGAREIAFSGGEPLLFDEIGKLVNTASEGGMRVLVYTSGNVKDFSSKIQKLEKAGLDKVIFSLYSSDKNSHEDITRIRGSFESTVSAIRTSISAGLNVELHFVALARNYRHFPELVQFGSHIGVDKVSVLRFVPQGRGFLLASDILTRPQYMELKKMIESLRADGHEIRTGSPFNFLLLSDQPQCNSAIDRLIVAPDLRVYPCDAFKQIRAEEVIGSSQYSIVNESTLAECWEKSPFLEAIRKYLTSPFAEPCDTCEFLESCLSGCLAQKFLEHNSLIKKPDPACMRSFFKKGISK